jgi:hypothetical protein
VLVAVMQVGIMRVLVDETAMLAPAGTRIERTEQIALQTLDAIKREVGPDHVEISLGIPMIGGALGGLGLL